MTPTDLITAVRDALDLLDGVGCDNDDGETVTIEAHLDHGVLHVHAETGETFRIRVEQVD